MDQKMELLKVKVGGDQGKEEEASMAPVSPTGQYFNSSVLSISVISVLESEIPIDDSSSVSSIANNFLPINPRFSSIMVKDENGVKRWKKVKVNIEEHVTAPKFPEGKSPDFYDDYLNDYLSRIATEPLPQSRPLWEIHIIKYPTTHAAGSLVFKLHHSLGDGYSLMGALLSCLQRADDPSLPLTFPSFRPRKQMQPNFGDKVKRLLRVAPKAFNGLVNTVLDFGWGVLKSSIVADGKSPVRSGDDGVEFRPINIVTLLFSLDNLKQIKAKLHVTINDVICGVIFLGTRMYMEETKQESSDEACTALVLLNTRSIGGYMSIDEMVQRNHRAESKWGNQFGFLHIPLPPLNEEIGSVPLEFVYRAQKLIKRKRDSSAVYFTGKLLEAVRKYRGPEATAKYIHSTLNNSSMTVSNMIGPVEKISFENHPVAGLYFMVVNVPQSLTITMMSYMGNLRVAIGMEKGLIDPSKFKTCINNAFNIIFDAAVTKY